MPTVVRRQTVQRKTPIELLQLESINRIRSIPIVESGWDLTQDIYNRIKRSNGLIYWGLGTAETSFNSALETALPAAVIIFGKPIDVIDKLVCKSLDIVEQRVPSINLPPQMMYWNTKEYVNTTLVKPVLKRADSVKQLGNTMLTSRYTEYAADTLDGALNVADKYVEKYLPAETGTDDVDSKTEVNDEHSGKAMKTIHHVDRFSRKLKRRLTRRTLAEAKALKEQSAEAIHVLIYVAELIATDPKQALVKAKELWATLSQDEPENQARPATLEQLVVMLTRESARRVVHLINYTRTEISKLPAKVSRKSRAITRQFLQVADSLVKTIHLEGAKDVAIAEAKTQIQKLKVLLSYINAYTTQALERLALVLAGGSEYKWPNITKDHQSSPRSSRYINNHNTLLHFPNSIVNGLD